VRYPLRLRRAPADGCEERADGGQDWRERAAAELARRGVTFFGKPLAERLPGAIGSVRGAISPLAVSWPMSAKTPLHLLVLDGDGVPGVLT